MRSHDLFGKPSTLSAAHRDSDWLYRVLDVAGALVGLVVLSPLLLSIYVIILILDGRPALFRQVRIGKDGAPFVMFKFRTMRQAFAENGEPLCDEKRLTPFGRFLRSTSLDETPELLNVLMGDMRLVGPRPMLPEYLGRCDRAMLRRHEIAPGITGWAQINGRNLIDWDEKVRLDLWYLDNRSLLLDMKILLVTLVKVFTREGVDRPMMGDEQPPRRFEAAPISLKAAQRSGF